MKRTIIAAPDVTTEDEGQVAPITDKKGFGARWGFSPRHVNTLLSLGMPHCKIGARRVRIIVAEADEWMKERFGVRRLGPLVRPQPIPPRA